MLLESDFRSDSAQRPTQAVGLRGLCDCMPRLRMGKREKSLGSCSRPVTPIVFAPAPAFCPNAAVPMPDCPRSQLSTVNLAYLPAEERLVFASPVW